MYLLCLVKQGHFFGMGIAGFKFAVPMPKKHVVEGAFYDMPQRNDLPFSV